MSESTWKALRVTLVERYDELAETLRRYVGSKDLAEEALQDTFLRLAREGELEPVRNPRSYLLRMAFNLAAARQRSEKRRLTLTEADMVLYSLTGEQPSADQVLEGRSELLLVRKALAELPGRRRAIVEAAWFEDVPYREIAARHNLSLRMIQVELKHAADHVAERLAKTNVGDFAHGRRESSSL